MRNPELGLPNGMDLFKRYPSLNSYAMNYIKPLTAPCYPVLPDRSFAPHLLMVKDKIPANENQKLKLNRGMAYPLDPCPTAVAILRYLLPGILIITIVFHFIVRIL